MGREDSIQLNTDENEFSFSKKLDNHPIRLFFDQAKNEHDLVFELIDGWKISEVLAECFGMEYFVSDENLSFLFSVNWYSIEVCGDLASRFES